MCHPPVQLINIKMEKYYTQVHRMISIFMLLILKPSNICNLSDRCPTDQFGWKKKKQWKLFCYLQKGNLVWLAVANHTDHNVITVYCQHSIFNVINVHYGEKETRKVS